MSTSQRWFARAALRLAGGAAALALTVAMLAAVGAAIAWPNLPELDSLTDYRPRLPLRIHSADGVLLGEFGEERRHFTPVAQMPRSLRDAVLATEDARFYEHGGVHYKGVLRAGLANLSKSRGQGASTITMQVARNFYLPLKKTFTRKVYEMLLALKIESQLGKDQILEIYMNQIYLGQRAYGFASASETYFGKPLNDLTLAEAAMLAGLPQSPIHGNPVANPTRATRRQHHVLDRMLHHGFISAEQHAKALDQRLRFRAPNEMPVHAEYAAEIARQIVVERFGPAAYDNGIDVRLTINAADQAAAYRALRKGLLELERRQPYRGPEGHAMLPAKASELDAAIADALDDHPDNDELKAAVVLEAGARTAVAALRNGESITVDTQGIKWLLRRGAVVRVLQGIKGEWTIAQLPQAEGALVAMDPRTGALRALVGGFDFSKSQFNHATQAWRQPGSALKPFLYAAALEKGFTPATVIDDAPLALDTGGAAPWEPKNSDGSFDGPITMRAALARSKNSVSVRILQAIGVPYAHRWLERFGLEADRQPPNLTMALGSGAATPLQMASAYSVFANGGYRLKPVLIDRISDARGNVLVQAQSQALDETARAIDERNAFIAGSLLQEVVRTGTAKRAQEALQRPDLHGKTGTTDDAVDAWFAGYQRSLVAVVWMGHDQPRPLGERESGGALALPVWIEYMRHALDGVPVARAAAPEGLVNLDGEWFYEEYTPASGVGRMQDEPPRAPSADERRSILDLFKR